MNKSDVGFERHMYCNLSDDMFVPLELKITESDLDD